MKDITVNRIKELILENDITQQTLADEIQTTPATLSRNMNGVHEPRADIIEKIAIYFNVSVDYLMGNTDVKEGYNNKYALDLANLNELDIALIKIIKGLSLEQKKQVLDFVEFIKNKEELK